MRSERGATVELQRRIEGYDCPVYRAVAVVGAKWTLLIIHNLIDGPMRFGELERALHDASPKMITARLREMEDLGLITRAVFAEVPPRVEYTLTEQGRTLKPIIDSLFAWGESLEVKRRR